MNRFVANRASWVLFLTVGCGRAPGAPVVDNETTEAPDGGSERPRDARRPTLRDAIDPASPPVLSSHPDCAISADCPAGQHCDLGECVQECNTELPCETGQACSSRARCLGPDDADEDPRPTTKRAGTLSVSPSSASLTERDESLSLTLKSDSSEPVRYRIQLEGPHLSVVEPRGSFVGETTVRVAVDGNIAGAESPGIVHVRTTLGDAVVSAPLRAGVTGQYEGTMTYDGDSIPLGSAGVSLALREEAGNVLARVNSARSLLFPPSGDTAIVGRGSYRRSLGAEFTVLHDVPAALGGERNRFKRRMLRTIRFSVKPDDRGNLAGTFVESIEGLQTRAVTLRGTVMLRRSTLPDGIAFDDSKKLEVPAVDVSEPVLTLGTAFPGWTEANCTSIRDPSTEAGESCKAARDRPLPGGCSDSLHYYATVADNLYYRLGHLYEAKSPRPIDEIAAACAYDLGRTPALEGEISCAALPQLACALSDVALSAARDSVLWEDFARLFSHVLEPALLVAQDEVAASTKASFLTGPSEYREALARASRALAGPAMWVMQPHLLEYLARIGASGGTAQTRALRSLGRLFFVQSTIDGELGRSGGGAGRDDELRNAQAGGLLALLEAAAMLGAVPGWDQSATSDAGSEVTDVLSPSNRAFRGLLEGDLQFGVPEAYVPLLNRPGDSSSNAAQVLETVEPWLTELAQTESALVESTRTYERNNDDMRKELLATQTGTTAAIQDICGESFVVDHAAPPDFGQCGKTSGEVRSLLLDIDLAHARIETSHARMVGMAEKIRIEYRRVQEVKEVREGTIGFVDANGKKLENLTVLEGGINTAQKVLETSAEASVFNFGAPLVNAAIIGILEVARTEINRQRVELDTAKEMRIRGDDANVEAMNGMAVIRSMVVDQMQLGVEMQQELIGLLQTQVEAANAVERARRLVGDLARTRAVLAKGTLLDPSFRILRDAAALSALRARADAQSALYRAGRALEYELNQPVGEALSRAVHGVFNASRASTLKHCLQRIATDAALSKGQPQPYVTELSLRKVLGVAAKRTDDVTGEVLTQGDLFRRIFLENQNLDGHGGAGVSFASSIQIGNGLWPINVCDDKITAVSVQLVGDFLGDDNAQVELELEGGGVIRRCDQDALVNWSTAGRAVAQAGVNSFGAAPPNRSLKGLSVASSRFKLVVPGASVAPANTDLDLRKVDDIVLRIEHEARPTSQNQSPISLECLANK